MPDITVLEIIAPHCRKSPGVRKVSPPSFMLLLLLCCGISAICDVTQGTDTPPRLVAISRIRCVFFWTVLWRPIEKILTLLGGINDVRLLHFSSVYTQKLGPWIGPHQHVFCASRLGEFLLQECFSSSIYSQYLQLALTGTLAAFIRLPHPPLPHVNSSITPPASLRMWPQGQTAQLSTSQEVPSRLLLW